MFNFLSGHKWILIFVALITTALIWYAVFKEERGGILKVSFLNVGQGDAVFVESPSGIQVLIDGGPDEKVLRELGRIMPFYDKSIDVVVATHPDSDHIGGLIDVLKRYDVRYILRPGVKNNSPATESLLRLIQNKGVGKRRANATRNTREILARRGQVVDLGGGVYLRILFPDRDVSKMSTNSASIVAQLVYGNHKFLFTGDSPQEVEEYVVRLDGVKLKSDVIKLGHHGSRTSTSDLLLGFSKAEYAIISAGKNNDYGHPHKEVLEKLDRFKIKPISTQHHGTITFKSDGEILYIDD